MQAEELSYDNLQANNEIQELQERLQLAYEEKERSDERSQELEVLVRNLNHEKSSLAAELEVARSSRQQPDVSSSFPVDKSRGYGTVSEQAVRETYNFRQTREEQRGSAVMPRTIPAREEKLDEFLSKPLDEFMQARPIDYGREQQGGGTRYEPWARDGSDSPEYSDEDQDNDVQKQSSERISALQVDHLCLGDA